MVSVIVVLLVSNIATVTSTAMHDVLYGAIARVAQLAGTAVAKRALAASPTARQASSIDAATRDLRARQVAQEERLKRLGAEHQQLQAKHAHLNQQHQLAMDKSNAQIAKTKQMASSIKTRLARGIARNTESLPAKAVPAIGVALTIGLTAWDIYDACKTIEDINSVLVWAGQPAEDVSAICGVSMPSTSQVLQSVSSNWRASVARTQVELAGMRGKFQVPEVRLPTKNEVLQVACPVVAIPGACP